MTNNRDITRRNVVFLLMFSSRAPLESSKASSAYSNAIGLKYPHRLNLFVSQVLELILSLTYFASYDVPPRGDITLEDFEIWAIDRLRVLGEIESSLVRNRTFEDMRTVTTQQCKKYLPLNSTSALQVDRDAERRKDHVSHFVLRLAFCRSYVAHDFWRLCSVHSYTSIVKNLDTVLSKRR